MDTLSQISTSTSDREGRKMPVEPTQESGMIMALSNWLIMGMSSVVLFMANSLRGKANKRHVEALEKQISRKIGKDQFAEFKEGNTALHKANSAKLDTVIAQLNSVKRNQ